VRPGSADCGKGKAEGRKSVAPGLQRNSLGERVYSSLVTVPEADAFGPSTRFELTAMLPRAT